MAATGDVDAPVSDHVISEVCACSLIEMTRELLFNVVKHAGVNQATLTVAEKDSHLMIEVKIKAKVLMLRFSSGRPPKRRNILVFSAYTSDSSFLGGISTWLLAQKPAPG